MMVGYLNFGDLLTAKCLFDEMPVKSLATWNAMIKGLVRFGELKSARILFDEMPERNKVSFTTMIDGYAKVGDMAAARLLFDKLSEKDLFSWSALISGYVQNGKSNEAVKVFGEMWAMNVKPDEFIMVSLMSACSQLGCLELARWVDSYISNNSFDLGRPHVSAALVDMNAKCGNMERANFLFEKMPKRDLISFCSMIQGFSIHGHGVQAVALFDRMINEELRPDDVAFTVILTACMRAGLVEDGFRYFDLMINEYCLSPSPDHYACMVDLLGKSGKLKAAYELIKSMPVEPHAGAWGALLGACKLHCDTDLAEEVALQLFELEPHSADSDILREIESSEEMERLETQEIEARMEKDVGELDEIYRSAREGELETTGQPVCIYENYNEAGVGHLHHGSLYRGLSLILENEKLFHPCQPEDGGHWSALNSWVMPTPSFLEFMFSRMFVDSLNCLHVNLSTTFDCLLGFIALEVNPCAQKSWR
ncbi:putative Pentatricopeptide repeat-containing protein [Abeliophyllum distichum]|uniref:Pentatricopeptide repeat-containing protein n=1 Tax=Abeliophyllum distichum TaxID=126358 RepID=A0ABD1V698_9LAMI